MTEQQEIGVALDHDWDCDVCLITIKAGQTHICPRYKAIIDNPLYGFTTEQLLEELLRRAEQPEVRG